MNNKILGTIVAVGMIRSFAPSFSGEDKTVSQVGLL